MSVTGFLDPFVFKQYLGENVHLFNTEHQEMCNFNVHIQRYIQTIPLLKVFHVLYIMQFLQSFSFLYMRL